MKMSTETLERRPHLSVKDAFQLALSFGMFVIALVRLIADFYNKDKDK